MSVFYTNQVGNFGDLFARMQLNFVTLTQAGLDPNELSSFTFGQDTDLTSGVSAFIPEPSSGWLLAFSGVVFLRRRQRV